MLGGSNRSSVLPLESATRSVPCFGEEARRIAFRVAVELHQALHDGRRQQRAGADLVAAVDLVAVLEARILEAHALQAAAPARSRETALPSTPPSLATIGHAGEAAGKGELGQQAVEDDGLFLPPVSSFASTMLSANAAVGAEDLVLDLLLAEARDQAELGEPLQVRLDRPAGSRARRSRR